VQVPAGAAGGGSGAGVTALPKASSAFACTGVNSRSWPGSSSRSRVDARESIDGAVGANQWSEMVTPVSVAARTSDRLLDVLAPRRWRRRRRWSTPCSLS